MISTDNKESSKNSERNRVSWLELFKFSCKFEKCLLLFGLILITLAGIAYSFTATAMGMGLGGILRFTYAMTKSKNKTEVVEAENVLMQTMSQYAIMSLTVWVIVVFAIYCSTVIFQYAAVQQIFKIRKLYFISILNQDMSWHDQHQTGDFTSRNTEDIKKIQDGLGEKTVKCIFEVIASILCIIQALIKGWQLVLVGIIPVPITFLAVAYFGATTGKYYKYEAELCGEASAVAEESLTNIKTVVSFGGQDVEKHRYKNLLKKAMQNNIKRLCFSAISEGVGCFSLYISFCLAIWYGISLVFKTHESTTGEYTIENLIMIQMNIAFVSFNINKAARYWEIINMARCAAVHVFQIINLQPSINKYNKNSIKLSKINGEIKFEDVAFNYPSRHDTKVLHNFNITIQPRQTVALVGSSGCGKSTCIQLIQRLYDPNYGKIYIDGIKLPDFDLHWLRNQIGVIGQEPVLFAGTIAENIKFGFLDATQYDIEKAAMKANAHAFITVFPNGYKTIIGERGTQLSGGQKQRIAIARALIRKPTILLIDEATSSLDSKSESIVQAALDSAATECTTIIVAHRLSTIKNVDKIIVVNNGRIVEKGTHNDLLAAQGAYAQLIDKQLSQGKHVEIELNKDVSDTSSQSNNNSETTEKDSTAVIEEKFFKHLNLKSAYETIKQLLKLSNSSKWIMLLAMANAVFIAIFYPLYGFLSGYLFTTLTKTDISEAISQCNIIIILIFMVGVGSGITLFLQIWLFGVVGEKLTFKLRNLMFSAILNKEISWFDRAENGVGSLGAKLSGEVANAQGILDISSIIICFIVIIITIVVGICFQYKLFLAASTMSLALIVSIYYEQKLGEQESTIYYTTMEASTNLAVEAISNIRTVASLGIEVLLVKNYMEKIKPYKKAIQLNIHFRGLLISLSESVESLIFFGSYYYGAILLKNEEASCLEVLMLSSTIVMSAWCIGTSLAFSPNFKASLNSAHQVLTIINSVSQEKAYSQDIVYTSEWNIDYNQVKFAYPNRPTATVLDNLNLHLHKGKTIALVGASGCGKSTIIQLLQRYYNATSGQIKLDKKNIFEMDPARLRMRLGVVSQDPNLFNKTIGENIAYGNNTRAVEKEEIIEAARKANIHNFIASLPLGYDTNLGERGTQISGGQKQRIAIARALIRDPEVLLLDEATSALDAENEQVVQEALENAKKERTTIIIAHRLKTIENADLIAVVSDGKIVESGSHSELINLKNYYWKLYNMQNKNSS